MVLHLRTDGHNEGNRRIYGTRICESAENIAPKTHILQITDIAKTNNL